MAKFMCKWAVPFVTAIMILCIPIHYGMIGYAFDHLSVMDGIVRFAIFSIGWVVCVILREDLIKNVNEMKKEL